MSDGNDDVPERPSKGKGTLIYGTPDASDASEPLAGLPSRSSRGRTASPPDEGDPTETPTPSSRGRTTGQGTVVMDEGPDGSPRSSSGAPPVVDDAEGFAPSRRTTRKGTVMMDDPEVPSTDEGRGHYDLDRLVERASITGPPSIETVRQSRERLSRLSVTLRKSVAGSRKKTTLVELGTIAQDVAVVTQRGMPRALGPSLLAASAFGLLLVFLALALLLPTARWVFTPLAFLAVLVLVALGVMHGLPRLVRRFGDRTLPGGLHVWLGGLVLAILGSSVGLTYGAQEATLEVAMLTVPELVVKARQKEEEKPEEPVGPPADDELDKGGRPLRVSPGTLYVPEHFSSDDGAFDLVLMFHGYPPLVHDSIDAAKLNAAVHVTNLGLGGAPYKARLARPDAFDRIVEKSRDKLEDAGLKGAKVRRVAVICWSAGYGALFQILTDGKRDTKVDAVLALDGLHGSFVGGSREVMPESVAPYVDYAKLAIDEKRLFVITHSAITTAEYASSTESADAILSALGLTRGAAEAPPAEVTFDTAVKAFPKAQPVWLEPTSALHEGDFHVFAYEGRTPEDHIAHLAQMSESVLPRLKARWEE